MRKRALTLLLLLSVGISTKAQNHFQSTWWGVSNSYPVCNDIIETSDGYLVGVGDAEAVSGNTKKCVVMKLDNTGDTLWTRTMHDNIEFGKQILETTDNNYLVLGDVWGNVLNRHTGIMKISPDGDMIWNRRYGLSNTPYYAFSMVETSDGNIFITGQEGSEVFILKIDPDGMIIWNQSYALPAPISNIHVQDIHLTQDGNMVIMAHTQGANPGVGSDDLLLAKLDTSGTVLWSKMIPAHSERRFGGMIPTYDGGYAITSMTDVYGPVAGDHMMVIKTDALGDVQWTTVLGKNFDLTFVFDIMENSNNDILITANTGNKGILTKLNENGNHMWTREYDFTFGTVEIYSIIESSDLGLIYGGKITNSRWYVFKGDSTGVSDCSDEGLKFNFVVENPLDTSFDVTFTTSTHAFMDTGYAFISSDEYTIFTEDVICQVLGVESEQPELQYKLEVYPNPSAGKITIEIDTEGAGVLDVKILNILGQEVLLTINQPLFVEQKLIEIDLRGYPSGLYNILVISKVGIFNKKLIIE